MRQTRRTHRSLRHPRPIALAALVTLVALAPGPSAFARQGSVPRGETTPHQDISLMWPVDFATGAVPPSGASNTAAGDQVLLLVPKATLSDSVAVGDFNRDGNSDVAQTNIMAESVSILLGDGRAGFAPAKTYPVGVNPTFVVAGKLNVDEYLDLAVADFGSGDVAILLGNGEGTFQPARFFSVPAPRSVGIGDFNGDDISDLAVASSQPAVSHALVPFTKPPTGSVEVFTGTGTGIFAQTQSITYTYAGSDLPINANSVAVDDFDDDGFDDLAVGVGYSRSAGARREGDPQPTGDDVLVFLNRNQAPATAAAHPFNAVPDQPPIRVGGSPDAIAVSDLNGDSHPDLAVAGNGSGDISSLLGDQDGHFVLEARNVTVGPTPRSVHAGDLNRDGIQDLVTGNFTSSTVSVLEGIGDGTFQPAVEFWSGDATTSAAIGHFDGDGRLDVVAGRLRNDHLALMLNDSPQPGDGVVIRRDIPFGSPTHANYDPWAEDHTLDVYSPPRGTDSFTGAGRPYPVVFFVHGGAGVGGDKSMTSYLLRSLAREGIVSVSTNYRLGLGASVEDQTKDVAHAFRWVHENIGSRAYGGDRNNIFVFSHSHGSLLAAKLGTESTWIAEQEHIRGLVLVSFCFDVVKPTPTQRPALLMAGDEGFDGAVCKRHSETFANDSKAIGEEAEHVTIAGRDHMTVLSDIALNGDPGRVAMLKFMQERLGEPAAGRVTLKGPSRVREGKRARLKVSVQPCSIHRGETIKLRRGKRRIDSKRFGPTCTETFSVRIERTSKFHAVSPAGRSNKLKVRTR